MSSKRSNKSAILCTVISVMLATLAAETSAQAGSTPARQLSAAVAEVLGSPFHDAANIADALVTRLPVPSVIMPIAWHREVGVTRVSHGFPDDRTPPAESTTSYGQVITASIFGALLGHAANLVVFSSCDTDDPGRFTNVRPGGAGSLPGGSMALCDHDVLGALFSISTPTLTTAGSAYLAGGGIWRALGGSGLGLLGGVLVYVGMWVEDSLRYQILPMVTGSIVHGLVAGLVAK